jgi:tetratricopeptide (TPR) repeat protein
MSPKRDRGQHPPPGLLERFMRNEAEPAERRWIVRHLIAGCARCLTVTRKLWSLGDAPDVAVDDGIGEVGLAGELGKSQGGHQSDRGSGKEGRVPGARSVGVRRRREEGRAPEASPEREIVVARFGDSRCRPAGSGEHAERVEPAEAEEERREGSRLAAELLAGPPAARTALLELFRSGETMPSTAGPAADRGSFLTPPVCDALLACSRKAAATDPAMALYAADLALAIAERLHAATGGGAVATGLRVRAWAHLSQARRLADDLEGAEWALAMAEALGPAGGSPVAIGPSGWAELLVFKAGLFADRGDLAGADRLLERAAGLFRAAAEPHRAGRAMVQQGLIRAELGDREAAAETLRVGVGLLDPASEPDLVAANLYRLAALLRGIALEVDGVGGATAPTSLMAQMAQMAPKPAEVRGREALHLVEQARALYRELGDDAAEAQLARLQGQIEAAVGRLDEAEATLRAAVAALARHGLGREAALAQVELAKVLARQGRAPEVRRVWEDSRPIRQALDKGWWWYSGWLVFHCLREPADPRDAAMLGELARFLAPRRPPTPDLPPDRRLARVA